MSVYLGIDWSQRKHDAAFLNDAGACLAQLTIAHSPDGFVKLDDTRARLGLQPDQCVVGLETAHNVLVDFLWDRGYERLFVVPPNVVKTNRGRYRQSGARTDLSDALVLADLLRTDRGRLHPWFPDSALTRQIRAKVILTGYLTRSIRSLSNRLRAVLVRYHPGASVVFRKLTSAITLAFIQAYPTPEAARRLTWDEFHAFGRAHRYPNSRNLHQCFARLQEAHPEASPDTVLVYQDEAPLLAGMLQDMLNAKKTTLAELAVLFDQHPDREIFASLPGAADFLAPALLSKFGDDRLRFPKPANVQALAGTCPVTKASGKRRFVHFRYACDREFRHIAQQWARSSLKQSAWANAYFATVRPRCRSASHAYRCLANRWLAVAWKLWQTHQAYDETYHHQQRMLRSRPKL